MMKIEIVRDGDMVTLRISGQVDEQHLTAIRTEVRRCRPRIVLDLAEATLVDRAVVRFLAARESEGVELRNCPRYIRRWIGREPRE
jgi:anti-anti-sigma regulatory factor